MSFRFSRYAPPSRRAIFYAREVAFHAGATEIDSMHLLSGLTLEESSIANRLFKLSERFPEKAASARSLSRALGQTEIPLATEGKRVLLFAEDEANRLDSYWVDTDHLILGILRQTSCEAAVRLAEAGIELETARTHIKSLKEAREVYGSVPTLWRLSKTITRIGHFAGLIYVLFIFLLISIFAEKGCWSSGK